MDVSEIGTWLVHQFNLLKEHIDNIYIFGSVAAGKANPGDCDVIIVCKAPPGSSERKKVRLLRDQAATAFLTDYGVPLNAVVLTCLEFKEKWFSDRRHTMVPLLHRKEENAS